MPIISTCGIFPLLTRTRSIWKRYAIQFLCSSSFAQASLLKYYRIQYSAELNSKARESDPEARKQFEFAAKNFRPLYFIRGYPSDPRKVEMSFDLSNYQPQFRGIVPEGGRHKEDEDPEVVQLRQQGDGNLPPLDHHVFQTIFLDKVCLPYTPRGRWWLMRGGGPG